MQTSIQIENILGPSITGYLISTAVIVGMIPVFGLLMETIINTLYRLCSRIIGKNAAYFLFNRLSFPGVAHHELSHALFAFLTGAKVRQIVLYRPDENRLGYVKYATRGNFIFVALQHTFSSIAPVVCGAVTCSVILRNLLMNHQQMAVWAVAIMIYLFVSVLIHMTMSSTDVKVMWKGLPIVFVLVFIIVWLTGMDLVSILSYFVGESPLT